MNSDASAPLYVAKADLFRSLGHPVRIRILELLVIDDQTVTSLAEDIKIDASSLSQHLAVLRRSGLVSSTRRANSVTYRLTDAVVADFLTTARQVLALRLDRTRQSLEALAQ